MDIILDDFIEKRVDTLLKCMSPRAERKAISMKHTCEKGY